MKDTIKVALVTGGATGIGRATALAFAKRGDRVGVADVNETKGLETVKMIKDLGGETFFVKADISKVDEARAMVKKTIERFGRLDYAVNNAGIEGAQGLTADISEADWDRVLQTNLRGTWLSMKYELEMMLPQKSGVIVNISSVAGLAGFAGISPYVASKHGMIGLTKSAALEYATSGIRINAVCPGVIRTEMIERFTHNNPEAEAQLIKQEPIGRMGEPEEIAAAVLWLCSDQSSFVIGHSLVVDGGFIVP